MLGLARKGSSGEDLLDPPPLLVDLLGNGTFGAVLGQGVRRERNPETRLIPKEHADVRTYPQLRTLLAVELCQILGEGGAVLGHARHAGTYMAHTCDACDQQARTKRSPSVQRPRQATANKKYAPLCSAEEGEQARKHTARQSRPG